MGGAKKKSGGGRANLLAGIRAGKKLKKAPKVEEEKPKPCNTSSQLSISKIQKVIQLKTEQKYGCITFIFNDDLFTLLHGNKLLDRVKISIN